MKTKIFVFCNSCSPEWHVGLALGEDGRALASHVSSDHRFLMHDMGLVGNWKHEVYNDAYPDGWELEWVKDFNQHEQVQIAAALNKKLGEQK